MKLEQPDQPYIDGAPNKDDRRPWRAYRMAQCDLDGAASPEVYFGPGNPIDAMENTYKVKLSARLNYRNAVFIEEQVVNSPEQRSLPYGIGPPPAMQLQSITATRPRMKSNLPNGIGRNDFQGLSN